jgi:exodeoxyribonuclease VII small subunit
MSKKNIKSFEANIRRLEEISSRLESDDINLEDSIKLYEEGINLSKVCLEELSKAELKITTLKNNFKNVTISNGSNNE